MLSWHGQRDSIFVRAVRATRTQLPALRMPTRRYPVAGFLLRREHKLMNDGAACRPSLQHGRVPPAVLSAATSHPWLCCYRSPLILENLSLRSFGATLPTDVYDARCFNLARARRAALDDVNANPFLAFRANVRCRSNFTSRRWHSMPSWRKPRRTLLLGWTKLSNRGTRLEGRGLPRLYGYRGSPQHNAAQDSAAGHSLTMLPPAAVRERRPGVAAERDRRASICHLFAADIARENMAERRTRATAATACAAARLRGTTRLHARRAGAREN